MQSNFTWSKGAFSNLYNIFKNGQQIGKLKDQTFSQKSDGELNGQQYRFQTKGVFNQRTEIYDTSADKLIGEIKYNSWMTKAAIELNGKTYNWKYTNTWQTKWSIFNDEGVELNFAGSSTKGHLETNIEEASLILCGLFVTNYYWQMTIAVIVAVFLPLWVTVIL